MFWPIELILFVFVVISALLALHFKDLLISVVMLTVFSFVMALLFVVMGAIDVGFTEAVVGAGITGVFFILAIFQTKRTSRD